MIYGEHVIAYCQQFVKVTVLPSSYGLIPCKIAWTLYEHGIKLYVTTLVFAIQAMQLDASFSVLAAPYRQKSSMGEDRDKKENIFNIVIPLILDVQSGFFALP